MQHRKIGTLQACSLLGGDNSQFKEEEVGHCFSQNIDLRSENKSKRDSYKN